MEPQPPATAETTADAPAPARDYHFEFSASGAEYFRIWIVNVALTILTLGIYSAWAKVRNRQYLYGNARLAGSSFEYTANPVNILKGRLLVFSVLVIYQLAQTTQPLIALGMSLALIPLLPWIVIKAVGFNLRYSAYRNLRFHFDGRYWQAFKLYILWTLAIGLSAGIAYPYVIWLRKRFLVDQARYGQKHFAFSGEAGYFYVVYICAILIYVGAMTGLFVVLGGIGALSQAGAGPGPGDTPSRALGIGLMIVMTLGFAALAITFNSAVQSLISNFLWDNTRIQGIRFKLALEPLRVSWIQFSNILAIIASAGLLIPWTKVRMLRYQLSRFQMRADSGALDAFLASERETISATGGEFGDAIDLDLGL